MNTCVVLLFLSFVVVSVFILNRKQDNTFSTIIITNGVPKKYRDIIFGIKAKLEGSASEPYYNELNRIYTKYSTCSLENCNVEEKTARCLAEYTVLMSQYGESPEPIAVHPEGPVQPLNK